MISSRIGAKPLCVLSRVELFKSFIRSEARKKALEDLKRFASLPEIPLLVLGERGIGKTRTIETIVKTIKQKEMTTLACGGLDSEVVDSLLFGHEKGAFTGASENRPGVLQSADGGVLFLDEIQDLPQSVQRKLVRVLQDRQRRFRPVGSDKETSVSFELICASNQSLSELTKKLDRDFFNRVSMLTVCLPPLRECREDLLTDWQKVWKELRSDERFPLKAPVSEALTSFFRESQLDGNLRDLQKIACFVMAYWQSNLEKALLEALEQFRQTTISQQLRTGADDLVYTTSFDGRTRQEYIDGFIATLSNTAKKKYGTWKSAAKALSCDESTLRKNR